MRERVLWLKIHNLTLWLGEIQWLEAEPSQGGRCQVPGTRQGPLHAWLIEPEAEKLHGRGNKANNKATTEHSLGAGGLGAAPTL